MSFAPVRQAQATPFKAQTARQAAVAAELRVDKTVPEQLIRGPLTSNSQLGHHFVASTAAAAKASREAALPVTNASVNWSSQDGLMDILQMLRKK